MNKGAFAVHKVIQPLVGGGGVPDDDQILAGKGMKVIHQQLEDVDGEGEIVAVLGEHRAGQTKVASLQLRRQIVLRAGAAAEMHARGGIQQIKAVVVQHGDEAAGRYHDVLAVQVAHDAVAGMQIRHGLGQIERHLQVEHPVVVGEHGLRLGHIAAAGDRADFHAVLYKGHGVADKGALFIAENILRPGQGENHLAPAFAKVLDGMLHHVADFAFDLGFHLLVDFPHQFLPGNPVYAALAAGANLFPQGVAPPVQAANRAAFLHSHAATS